MSTLGRQNTLFVAEDWIRVYEALENVDFRAYDFDNLVQALMQYLRVNYPEEFNDWIASSEFVTKIEILAWLSQNIAFRMDLNTRENFLATAERRESLIRLAQNIAYKVNRVRGSRGLVKVVSIRTTQPLKDSNNIRLQNKDIRWNDTKDEDWFERFIVLMNAAFQTRTRFGKPLAQTNIDGIRQDQYLFNSIAPASGTYSFGATVNGIDLPFDLHNAKLNKDTGEIEEIAPATDNAFSVFYRLDGTGFGRANSGFFFPIKQGQLLFQDERFADPIVLRTLDINTSNINNDDFFVQKIDETGGVLEDWTEVDTIFGESVSFNTLDQEVRNIYELDTLTNDRIRVRFGDGRFGRIPVGRYRFWYRTSNPQPLVVKPTGIQNKTFTIPYVVDNQIFYLSFTFSLQEQLTNAATTETNFDIRNRANKVFYTQNRMITAQDYNNFFLKDNSIQKIKTINRTYSGHSRYSTLTDPTGLYQNVKHIAEDGRFYQEETTTIDFVRADTTVIRNDEIVNINLKPLLRKEDKRILYYNRYTEIYFPTFFIWRQTSVIQGESRGNIVNQTNQIVPVGPTQTSAFKYVGADSLLRLDNINGRLIRVDRVIEDGTTPDGIILSEQIEDGAKIFSVFPPFRNRLRLAEESELKARLEQKVDFGLSWNQITETWTFINFSNIDKIRDFTLVHQGDTTGSNLDASWMVLVEFVPGGDVDDRWKITDRGLGIFWESAREVNFIFTNTTPVIDPETGLVVQDEVTILGCNESRDSLRRRGLDSAGSTKCEGVAFTFLGDGVTKCFTTPQTLTEDITVVTINGILQIPNVDYTITHSVFGDSVCLAFAPAVDDMIIIRVSNQFNNAIIRAIQYNGDGNKIEFDLDVQNVITSNTFSFIDGVLQTASLDYGVGLFNGNATIVYNEVIPAGTSSVTYSLSGIDSLVFNKTLFTGDDVTNSFVIPGNNLTRDHVLITFDGLIQAMFTYALSQTAPNQTTVLFLNPPASGVRINILSVANTTTTKTKQYEFGTDGLNQLYNLTGVIKTTAENVIVAIDGVMQEGSYSPQNNWTITGNNILLFTTPPLANQTISVFVIIGAIGTLSTDTDDIDLTPDNRGNISASSCLVRYLGEDLGLNPVDVIRHDDGYVNKNGLFVKPADQDQSGFYDRPLLFRDLVLMDGFTDLVLWRKIEEFGFDVWDPINQMTTPKGTYGLSNQGKPGVGSDIDEGTTRDGDIHYDLHTDLWLIANGETLKWEPAADQAAFKYLIGRDHLKFIWTHYSPEANRIDPSVSNIMNAFILTGRYDQAYRNWLRNNGAAEDEPVPSSSEQLRIQYADLLEFKAVSDAVIFYPARYKPLFGDRAVPELRATFKIIQTTGSTVSESDLRLRVLRTINTFFDVNNWDFGERFYFTELCAYIHSQLAPELQTVVIVPRSNDQAFGRLFQVRCEPDELFIRAAQPDDIEVVSSLTDEELRIGVFS